MKVKSVLLALLFGLTPLLWAQEPQAPPAGGSQARAEQRQKMMEMHNPPLSISCRFSQVAALSDPRSFEAAGFIESIILSIRPVMRW